MIIASENEWTEFRAVTIVFVSNCHVTSQLFGLLFSSLLVPFARGTSKDWSTPDLGHPILSALCKVPALIIFSSPVNACTI